MQEQHKTLIRRFYEEVMNKGNLNAIDELCAPSYVERAVLPPGISSDREGLKQLCAMLRQAFPDLHFTVEDEIAEGDKAVARTTMRGTNLGAFADMPSTGKQVTVTGIDIVRFEGGKAVEHWANQDDLGMMHQLGVIPAQ